MSKRTNLILSVFIRSDRKVNSFDIAEMTNIPASLRAFADLLESGVRFGLDSDEFEVHIRGRRGIQVDPESKKGGIK